METTVMRKTVLIYDEECEMTAHKIGKTWKAFGQSRGQLIQGHGARSAQRAFENWENRAKMVADSL
jgi:hypothetical protein